MHLVFQFTQWFWWSLRFPKMVPVWDLRGLCRNTPPPPPSARGRRTRISSDHTSSLDPSAQVRYFSFFFLFFLGGGGLFRYQFWNVKPPPLPQSALPIQWNEKRSLETCASFPSAPPAPPSFPPLSKVPSHAVPPQATHLDCVTVAGGSHSSGSRK